MTEATERGGFVGVVAVSRDGFIGRAGTIPWRYSEDLRFFKRTTLGGTLILGRKTWASLPRRPLPKRDHVVLTRDPETLRHDAGPRVRIATLDTLDAALDGLAAPRFVIGGAEIYVALADRIDTWWVTRIPIAVPDGDVRFDIALSPGFALAETLALSDACRVERWTRRSAIDT